MNKLPIQIDTCGHDLTGSGLHLVTRLFCQDWLLVVGKLIKRKVTMAGFYRRLREVQRAGKHACVRICNACSNELPSEKNDAVKESRLLRDANKRDDTEREEKIKSAHKSGAVLYECPGCEELIDEDDLVQLRQCPHCEESGGTDIFDGTENGRNCPECNRPFTRKLADAGCADCLDGDDLPYPYKKEEER